MMAHAAQRAVVTVEKITGEDLMADDSSAAASIASMYVNDIAVARRVGHPGGRSGSLVGGGSRRSPG